MQTIKTYVEFFLALVSAFGIMWVIFKPSVDNYLSKTIKPVLDKVDKIDGDVKELKRDIKEKRKKDEEFRKETNVNFARERMVSYYNILGEKPEIKIEEKARLKKHLIEYEKLGGNGEWHILITDFLENCKIK